MPSKSASQSERAAIERRTAELLAAVNASDADRVLDVWTDDGILMPPNHPMVRGRVALREYFRNLFSRSRFRFVFTSSSIHVAGDTAFERVTYTALAWPAAAVSPVEDAGKGLHVYRRQSDGSWQLACDIWNSDRPAAASE